MDILVTGVNGFIAQSIVEGFKEQGYNVYGIDVQGKSVCELDGYYQIDITKHFKIKKNFDLILHLAAFNRTYTDANFEYEQFYKVNVIGTKNVIEGCNFKKFVFMSTVSIYNRKATYLTEESEIDPINNYAKSKYEAECICKRLVKPQELLILRCINIAGIKQANKAVIPIFFEKAMKNEDINIFVPKNRTLQLLDINDLLLLYLNIFKSTISGTYNVSIDDEIQLYDLATKIINICNSKSKINVQCEENEDRAKVIGDKLSSMIDWRPKKSILDILKDYYDELINDVFR